jgi:hypothetical protein
MKTKFDPLSFSETRTTPQKNSGLKLFINYSAHKRIIYYSPVEIYRNTLVIQRIRHLEINIFLDMNSFTT